MGVDIGGTFTDIVLLASDGSVATKKVSSTPDDYGRAIATGLAALVRESGVVIDPDNLRVDDGATRRLRRRLAGSGERRSDPESHVRHFVRSLGLGRWPARGTKPRRGRKHPARSPGAK